MRPFRAPAFFAGIQAALLALALVFASLSTLHAQGVLFIGNSFTFTYDIPGMVENIATAKGKTVLIKSVTKGGKGWDYHLSHPETDDALKRQRWNWVVLQDYSLNATHVRNVEDFTKFGEKFYDRIAQESPQANILLYETWAYSPRHPLFKGTATDPATFANPGEMLGEIHKNYAALQALLQAKDPKRAILIAPVGTAFAQCAHEHPEINLYAIDNKHPNVEGSYLAALVIYATLFSDSPSDAIDGPKTDPATDKILREIASAVTQKK